MKKEAVAQAVLAGRADGQRIGPIASAAENMARVGAQADKVRSMKAAKAPNDQIAAEVSRNRLPRMLLFAPHSPPGHALCRFL